MPLAPRVRNFMRTGFYPLPSIPSTFAHPYRLGLTVERFRHIFTRMGTPRKSVRSNWLRSILFLLSLSSAVYAQGDTAWLFRYPKSEPLAFFADDTGNVYVAGWSEPSEDRLDALLLKIDSLGRLVWRRTYDHVTVGGAARDDSGHIYLSGNSNGAAAAELFLLKCKPDGDTEWVRTYGETGKQYGALGSVAFDDSGNTYICGADDRASGTSLRVLRYRPDGALARVMSYALDTSTLFCSGRFNILGDGGAYLVLAVAPSPEDWPCRRLIVRLSSQGRVLWKRVYRDQDSTWDDVCWSQIDKNGNIYITGHTTRHEGFGTIKLDSSGDVIWTRVYSHTLTSGGGDAFLIPHNGNVYVASGGWDTIRLVKYDSLGNQLWYSKYGNDNFMLGYGQGYDDSRPDFCCMSVDDSGNVYITGEGLEGRSEGNGRVVDSLFAFLVKYDPQGHLVWEIKRPCTNMRPDGLFDVNWSGSIVGLDRKGALYDIGVGGASAEDGIYVLKYRTR